MLALILQPQPWPVLCRGRQGSAGLALVLNAWLAS